MGQKKVLIIGATGMIGGKVVNSFIDNNFQVKILTRDIKKAQKKLNGDLDIFEGNVLDPKSLIGAFNNVDGVYIHLNDFNETTQHKTFTEGVQTIIDLAKFHKLNRVILQSAAIASAKNISFPLSAAILKSEELIKKSGLNYTILKPGYFLEALKFFLRGNQVSIIGDGQIEYNWVAGDEYAEKAVEIYMDDSYFGKTKYIFGPKALTLKDALKIYCDVVKPNARFNALSHEMMHSISRFSNNKEMSFIADYIEFMDKTTDGLDDLDNNDSVLKLEKNIEKWVEKQYVAP